jgi:hypothetical protein
MRIIVSADDVVDVLDAVESYLLVKRYHSNNPMEETSLDRAIDLITIARDEVELDCPLVLSDPGNEHGSYECELEIERRLC